MTLPSQKKKRLALDLSAALGLEKQRRKKPPVRLSVACRYIAGETIFTRARAEGRIAVGRANFRTRKQRAQVERPTFCICCASALRSFTQVQQGEMEWCCRWCCCDCCAVWHYGALLQ